MREGSWDAFRRKRSVLFPSRIGNDSNSFLNGNKPIRGDLREGLPNTVWPAHADFSLYRGTKTEVKSKIVAGEEAGLAEEFLRLRYLANLNDHAGANRTPIGLRADEFYLKPVIAGGNVISEQ